MLPVTEHVRARHAVWGARLVCALAQPLPLLWAVAARGALAAFSHVCHPLALLAWKPSPLERACLPALLLRLCDDLAALPPIEDVSALPPIEDVSGAPLEPGPWCAIAPLWHNPLLPAADRATLAADYPVLVGAGLTTVAGLAVAAAAVTSAIGRTEFQQALAIHLPGMADVSGPLPYPLSAAELRGLPGPFLASGSCGRGAATFLNLCFLRCATAGVALPRWHHPAWGLVCACRHLGPAPADVQSAPAPPCCVCSPCLCC